MEDITRKEIQHYMVLAFGSFWASSSFRVPKKTGDIHIVIDFKELYKWVEVYPFPLPKINETLQKIERFKSVILHLIYLLASIRYYLMEKVKRYVAQFFCGEIRTSCMLHLCSN